jgi:hypothetical protein
MKEDKYVYLLRMELYIRYKTVDLRPWVPRLLP